jgi:hypothetical protein
MKTRLAGASPALRLRKTNEKERGDAGKISGSGNGVAYMRGGSAEYLVTAWLKRRRPLMGAAWRETAGNIT